MAVRAISNDLADETIRNVFWTYADDLWCASKLGVNILDI